MTKRILLLTAVVLAMLAVLAFSGMPQRAQAAQANCDTHGPSAQKVTHALAVQGVPAPDALNTPEPPSTDPQIIELVSFISVDATLAVHIADDTESIFLVDNCPLIVKVNVWPKGIDFSQAVTITGRVKGWTVFWFGGPGKLPLITNAVITQTVDSATQTSVGVQS